ncbi:MAG: DUF3576 domain-containing protein [Rhodospirillales bacterium]|jgi:hypothetical protein|nr:DUF3576 domain-containing protein [Rhodospirillales bacterium]
MASTFLTMIRTGLVLVAFTILVSGCAYTPKDPRTDDKNDNEYTDYSKRKTVFGGGGFNLFGTDSTQDSGGSLGVNSFLWRASLETISFMPINTADAFGGVIITDWYSPPESPSERFKLNVYILGRTLRADGIKVSVFRQLKDREGVWADATVPNGTAPKVEDSILTKARILRHQTLTAK